MCYCALELSKTQHRICDINHTVVAILGSTDPLLVPVSTRKYLFYTFSTFSIICTFEIFSSKHPTDPGRVESNS